MTPVLSRLAPGHDPLQGSHRSVTGIASARTRLCPERHVPAEAVEWRVTIVPVVAVIEAPPLSPVDRVIGRIEIQDDHPSRARRGRHRPVGQRALNPRGVGHDPLVAGVRPLHAASSMRFKVDLPASARPRSRHVRRFSPSGSLSPHDTAGGGSCRVVIVEILISQRGAETTLSRQLFDRMPDQIRVAMVAKATRQTPHETVLVFDLARGERAAVTGKIPSLEIRLHSPLTGVLKSEALLFTLRHPVVVGLVVRIGLVTDTSHSNRGHPGLYPVRNAG